jgi:hypothetical protein
LFGVTYSGWIFESLRRVCWQMVVLPLDCLLIYLRKKDPSRGGLGSFVFTPVCPRLWLCMAWAGFFVQLSVGVPVSI